MWRPGGCRTADFVASRRRMRRTSQSSRKPPDPKGRRRAPRIRRRRAARLRLVSDGARCSQIDAESVLAVWADLSANLDSAVTLVPGAAFSNVTARFRKGDRLLFRKVLQAPRRLNRHVRSAVSARLSSIVVSLVEASDVSAGSAVGPLRPHSKAPRDLVRSSMGCWRVGRA
jgi:hypothetical protein